jgi:hypothetical protein
MPIQAATMPVIRKRVAARGCVRNASTANTATTGNSARGSPSSVARRIGQNSDATWMPSPTK